MYKLEIILKTISPQNFKLINKILNKLTKINLFKQTKINLVNLPVSKKKIFTVLKSPHVYKKSREQFKYVTYKRKIIINSIDINTLLYIDMIFKNSVSKDLSINSKLIKN